MSKHSIPVLEAARLASEERAGLSLLASETEDNSLTSPSAALPTKSGRKLPRGFSAASAAV
jgi:hypothetical protein